MKISAYHKQRGDDVDFINYLERYDLVYASKVFSFTDDIETNGIVNADEIRRGVQVIVSLLKTEKKYLTLQKINLYLTKSNISILITAFIPTINMQSDFLQEAVPVGAVSVLSVKKRVYARNR
ncbi:MAG: hypothetical protein ACI4IS_00355 [Acutalibacteraceae bacterium]